MSASHPHELPSLGLRRVLFALAACVGLGAATTGCFVITDGGGDPLPPADTPAQELVDTGATMSVDAGQGAGLFIEYTGGGQWDVFTSCDTDVTNRPCDFDVIISVAPGVSISAPTLHDAEPVDTLELRSDGSFRITTGTASGLDGVTFTTDPGASIVIDMLLDGQAQPDYIRWVSGGALQAGTTTNPAEFIPSEP
ncbi:MAG: hypothetical protein QM820_42655 [Minicystis sp.]